MTIDKFNEFYSKSLEDEGKALMFLRTPDSNKEYILISLIDINVCLALYHIFKTNNSAQFKNRFYIASSLAVFLHKNYDNGNYVANIFLTQRNFCYAILSDNPKMINHYLQYDDHFLKTFMASFAKAVQACIKNDDSELSNQIELLAKYTSKKTWEKNFVGCVDAFKGILQKDKLLIEKGINDLIAKHDKQDHPAVVKDFINLEATTIAKLAYKRGIDVQIDSPLVPKDLIPTKELDHYERYDFLAPLP